MKLEENVRIVAWTAIGLVIGIAFGLVWHVFEPGLALWFWPVFGALIFGQHAYRSSRRIRHRRNQSQEPPAEHAG